MNKFIKIFLFFLLILAILLNINWIASAIAGLILGLLYFLIFGFSLGKIIFKAQNIGWQLIFGMLSLISAYSFLGAIVYYFYQLNQLSVSLLFSAISIAILIFDSKLQNSKCLPLFKPWQESRIQNLFCNLKSITRNLSSIILKISYLILFATAIYILFTCQTIDAIRSPWQVIPPAFLIIYFLATLNLLLLLLKRKTTSYNLIQPHKTSYNPIQPHKTSYNLILISAHFFLTTSVALIIYKLGYGFDPFIHQVTELAIFKQGAILPKPFYYLGQYSLVVFLAHLLQISVEWIDKLLLPILLSVFLPYTIYKSLIKTTPWPANFCQILTFIFLLLPFNLLIATTPQGLAVFFSLIILFLSFLYLKNKQIPFWYLSALALVALLIHALAGIPIIIYLGLVWLLSNQNKATKIIAPLFAIFASISIPFALYSNSLFSIYKTKITATGFNLLDLPNIFTRQYNYFLDLAYFYRNSIYWLFILIGAITLVYLITQKKDKIFRASILTFVILIINAILLNFISVSFIIDYEQGDFAKRIWQLAFYFLLPVVICGFYLFIDKAQKNQIYKIFIIFLLSSFITFNFYLSYPRFDDYDNSRFINVSATDFAAVDFIEKNSDNQPYIVLTNQMTSAAALKTFGFSRYYNGHYFYPIPTGGDLYSYFEKMIYEKPAKQTAVEAMELAGVSQAYFALPGYWSRFKIIAEDAKKEADDVFSLDDKVLILKYLK